MLAPPFKELHRRESVGERLEVGGGGMGCLEVAGAEEEEGPSEASLGLRRWNNLQPPAEEARDEPLMAEIEFVILIGYPYLVIFQNYPKQSLL